MADRTVFRLNDIIDAIEQIDLLLAGKSFEDLVKDRVLRAAFERFLEILSEASRHVPDEIKARKPEIEWSRIAAIGNHLRHAYHRVDAEILWQIYAEGKLALLHEAVNGLLST
jgi:uncharacterized protein with HEPN domain